MLFSCSSLEGLSSTAWDSEICICIGFESQRWIEVEENVLIGIGWDILGIRILINKDAGFTSGIRIFDQVKSFSTPGWTNFTFVGAHTIFSSEDWVHGVFDFEIKGQVVGVALVLVGLGDGELFVSKIKEHDSFAEAAVWESAPVVDNNFVSGRVNLLSECAFCEL